MNQIRTRTLTIEDYDAIVKLWKSAELPFKPKGRDRKESVSKQMQLGKVLVGVVIGSYDGRMKGWINRLAVKPEYRRKGIAKQLISLLEKVLERKGATIHCTLIEAQNEESLNLFQNMGYVIDSEILYVTKRRSSEA